MLRKRTLTLCILIAIGALAGLYGAWLRYRVEARNHRVELAMDLADIKNLSTVSGLTVSDTIARLKRAGITSVSITEDTLAFLEQNGDLHPKHRGKYYEVTIPNPDLGVKSPPLIQRIYRGLSDRGIPVSISKNGFINRGPAVWFTPELRVLNSATGAPPTALCVAGIEYMSIRTLGIGLDPISVNTVRRAGMIPLGRISNFPGARPYTMRAVLSDLKHQGIRTVIFQGLEVMGFRGQQKDAANALRDMGIAYGQVEFGKQKGDDPLSVELKGDYIRVHSIADAEMGALDDNEIIDRYVRAARERNIRICYIRPVTLQGTDPLQTNEILITKIARGIARGHEMSFGASHEFSNTGVPGLIFALIGLGVAAGFMLLASSIFSFSDRVGWLTLLGLILVCVGLSLAGDMGRKLNALLAALVFPTLACLRRDILSPELLKKKNASSKEAAGMAITGLIVSSAITSLGIYLVVGLLATRPFMLKADQFIGIKAAHAIPILLIGLLAIAGLPTLNRNWPEEREKIRSRLSAFLSEPTRVGMLLLTLVALVIMVLIVARTGNDPGVGISGIELKFRSLLDRLLPVRPRTKEFLLGHPAFVLALALWFRGRKKWALPLFVVGVIGQVSLLNTFCHIHTPLHLSFIRDITGLVFGGVIGLGLFWLTEIIWKDTPASYLEQKSERAGTESNA